MLPDELREKEKTVLEIMARLNLQDEEIAKRVESKEFQSLVKKAFREWAGTKSETKREYVRNILVNAAASRMSSDDVVRLFLNWLDTYSELHFQVIAAIFNSAGITRGQIWTKIGKGEVREDSADADLYKLLFRDLSTGGIIRQHRETDYYGNFLPKTPERRPKGSGPKPIVSAFDDDEGYELTELGKQFVHYAMTELPPKIEFAEELLPMTSGSPDPGHLEMLLRFNGLTTYARSRSAPLSAVLSGFPFGFFIHEIAIVRNQ